MQKVERVGTKLVGCVRVAVAVLQWTKAIGISCLVRMMRAALLMNELGIWQTNLSHSISQA